jgi:prevent-host-death family protein
MSTVTLEEAQAKLPELIARMAPGEELVITRNAQPVAKLVSALNPQTPARKLGTMRGTVRYIAAEFDAPLPDFKEYME